MYPHGEKALPVNEVRAACVAELHSLAYDQFKTTQDYKGTASRRKISTAVEEGERVLIYRQRSRGSPRNGSEDAKFDELKALDAIKNDQETVYEAWTC